MKKSRLLYKIYKIQFQTFGTWFTIWHYCFRIENWRIWHQFWNPRCLHGIQNSFFLWQSGTNDLSLWNQQWTISILRWKDVCKNSFRKNLWNIWRINSLDFNIYRAWVNTVAAGAWHPPEFWTSPLAPTDVEVLNTNLHPQSSFNVTSGTLSFDFLTQALTIKA